MFKQDVDKVMAQIGLNSPAAITLFSCIEPDWLLVCEIHVKITFVNKRSSSAVEHRLAKARVASSNLVFRSRNTLSGSFLSVFSLSIVFFYQECYNETQCNGLFSAPCRKVPAGFEGGHYVKVKVEKKEHNITELVVELPVEAANKAFDKAFQKLAQQVNIPGFRKGKAPRKLIESRVGIDGMRAEAFDFIIPDAYRRAVTENSIDPVGRPEVTDVTLNPGEPCVFSVSVVTLPEVTLGDYKGLNVSVPATEVADEEVDKQIDALRERHAKMVVAEGVELAQGDFAIIDFDGMIDGKPFSGGQSKGYPLEVGSGSFIPGFEEQLIGAKSGEEREVKVTFPQDYFVPELAGKEAVFTTKINDIKRKELPEINDDFAKETGEADTLEEMKAAILKKLTEAAHQKDESAFREAAVSQAVTNATIEVS